MSVHGLGPEARQTVARVHPLPASQLDWDAEHAGAEEVPPPQAVPHDGAEQTEADFWESRPLFRWCRDMGRARMLSPDALLGYMLARIRAQLGHRVFIPAMVGHRQALNLGIIQCGRSGGGKTAVREAVDEMALWSPDIPLAILGSGEGLVDTFASTEKDDDGTKHLIWHTHSALFIADEIDMIEALNARRGGTLMSTIRSAISGTRVGFGYRGNGTQLPAREYALCIVVAAQPTRMQWLLDEADAGTPQRFLWFNSDYPDMPGPNEHWPEPADPPITLPPIAGTAEFVFPEDVRSAVRQARYDNRSGEKGEMFSHLMLTRCKVAALLAATEARMNVTDYDWTDAGILIARSQAVIDATTTALRAESARALEKQGKADGHRQIAAEKVITSASENRVALRIGRHIHAHQTEHGCTRKCFTQMTTSKDRDCIPTAIERAMANDWTYTVERPHPNKHQTVTYYQRGAVAP